MVRVATGLCQENEHLIVTVTVIPEYIHSKLVGCFSDVLWHTHGARSLIVNGRSITACFILLFLIKPAAKKKERKKESPAPKPFRSPIPQCPQFPVGGVFFTLLPLAPLPCQTWHVTAVAHGLPAPPHCTPILCSPVFSPTPQMSEKYLPTCPGSLVTLPLQPK